MGSIDSDAHVIETMTTFDYIEPEYRHLRPRVVRQVEGEHVQSNEGAAQKEFWIIDGRLQPKEHNVGSNTSDVSREMRETRKEITFGKEHGACGIFIRGLEAEMRVVNPYFFRLYEMAQEFDLPVCFHSGNNSFQVRDIYAAEGGFGRSKLPVVGAFHNLIMDDIPKKFPKVRWGFIEVSAQWLPYAFNDLDLRFKRKDRKFPADPLKAYQMYVACQCADDLPYILKHGGADNIVIGTDYGHADTSSQIEALRLLKNDGKIEKSVIDRILNANARALYGFN